VGYEESKYIPEDIWEMDTINRLTKLYIKISQNCQESDYTRKIFNAAEKLHQEMINKYTMSVLSNTVSYHKWPKKNLKKNLRDFWSLLSGWFVITKSKFSKMMELAFRFFLFT
jgi:hypothetical protein